MAEQEVLLKNQYGSVKPYTRHHKGCETPNDNSCKCAKWLYVRYRDGRRQRYSLGTPSWTEAVEKATDKLAELNPEIAEARQAKAKQELERKTVWEAIQMWMQRSKNELGEDSSTLRNYRSLLGWVDDDGVRRGGLFRYAIDEKLEYIDQFTPVQCQQFLASKYFTKLAPLTRRARWGVVRSFFDYLFKLGVLTANPAIAIKAPKADDNYANVPYTDTQYAAIHNQAEWYVADNVRNGERTVYIPRQVAFLELLRGTGMDVIDAVQLRPDEQIRDTTIDGQTVSILRYNRTKTGKLAVIPISAELALKIRSVPPAPKSVPGQPFRYQGNDIASDARGWERRLDTLIGLAEIGNIQLIDQKGRLATDKHGAPIVKDPNIKMLRHTFAVAELDKGVPEELVARMLGHSSAKMVEQVYGPWCQSRDEAHIKAVMKSRQREVKDKKKRSR